MLYLSPLGQFKIYSYFNYGVLTLTNFSLTAITFVAFLFMFGLGGTLSSNFSFLKSNILNKLIYKLPNYI